eukprot:scaffold2751_cov131-Cylindrotheca_fusiformis.AAC.6
MASFSVKNRVAMFEKPKVDMESEPEVPRIKVALKAPVSPSARSATSYSSTHSQRSARTSDIGGGPYSSGRTTPKSNDVGSSTPRMTPRQATTPTKAMTPKSSTTPRRMQQASSSGKVSSPFLTGKDQVSKPVVLPSKSNKAPPGWATDNLRSSGLVSRSPFRKPGSQEVESVTESRDVWSSQKEVNESRDDALLKNSLNAASVVLEEEKSAAGSSNASSRSSLSTKELGDIAKRALNIAKKKSSSPSPEEAFEPVFFPEPSSSKKALSTGSAKSKPSESWKAASFGPALFPEPSSFKKSSTTRAAKPAPGKSLMASYPVGENSESISISPQSGSTGTGFGSVSESSSNDTQSSGASRPKNRSVAVAAAKRDRTKPSSTATTPTAPTNSESRRALLANAKRSKERKDEVDKQQAAEKRDLEYVEASARLGTKASRVLAMKNSLKSENSRDDASSVASFESGRSGRRIDHPAFAARSVVPSPKPKQLDGVEDANKPLSRQLKTNIRHFSAVQNQKRAGRFNSDNEGGIQASENFGAWSGRKHQPTSSSHTKEDATKDCSFVEQEDSLHSMGGQNYFTQTPEEQGTSSNAAPSRKPGPELALAPGPSSRPGHSMAKSIVANSPLSHSTAQTTDFGNELRRIPSDSKSLPAGQLAPQEKDCFQFLSSEKYKERSSSPPGAETSVEDFFGNDFLQATEVEPEKEGALRDNSEPVEADQPLVADKDLQAADGKKSVRDTSTGSKNSSNTSIRTGLSSIQSDIPEKRSDQFGSFPEGSQHPSKQQSTAGLPDPFQEKEEKVAIGGVDAHILQEDNKTSEKPPTEEDFNTGINGTVRSKSNAQTATQPEPSTTILESSSQVPSKKSSSWWKGKKMKSKMKTVLSKKPTKPMSVDDDIFGGLEDEKTPPKEEKKTVTASRPTNEVHDEKKTQDANATPSVPDADAKPIMSEANAKTVVQPPAAEKAIQLNQKQVITPDSAKLIQQNDKSVHSVNDRSGTNVEYEEKDDVASEITSSILEKKTSTAAAESKAKTTDVVSLPQSKTTTETVPEQKEESTPLDQNEDPKTNPAEGKDDEPRSIFLNLGCGIGEMLDAGLCNYGSTVPSPKKKKSSVRDGISTGDNKTPGNPGSSSAKEDQVWKEWENREASANTDRNDMKQKENSEPSDAKDDSGATNEKKTEVSSSQNRNIGDVGVAQEVSMEITKEISKNHSEEVSMDELINAPSADSDASRREETTRHSRYSALSASTPMTLSNNQRSLVEKFSKHLSSDGVEVLKLNSRNQWQVRFFTISKEQVALSAHEALKPTGDVAQCPKALLWVKKFSSKSTYGISHIDKLGHGGMMLASLVNVQVIPKVENKHLIPKRMQEKFKKPVLVILVYNFDGAAKSVEFLCREDDQAQFLCTCIRVSRDLLKREENLRKSLKEI